MPRTLADDLGHARRAARGRRDGWSRSCRPSPRRSRPPARSGSSGRPNWCTHPADLDDRGVARVRGTKNPDLAAVAALRPDLVVANKEENRELDVRRMRERGIPVWVTDIETVPQAVASMRRLLREVLGLAADPALARRGGGGVVRAGARRPGARRRAGLAGPLDGRRAADLHGRPARPGGVRGGDRRGRRALPGGRRGGPRRPRRRRPRAAARTSRTSSPRTTDRRPSGGCRPGSCRAVCSPGTGPRWSSRGFRWTDPERVMSPSRPGGVRDRRTPP